MSNIDLSVVVPVYNSEQHLEKCLDSILSQKQIDIEVIIIDDGSKDNSLEICKCYEKLYKNVTVISSENKGPASARNKGIIASKGKYITFVDSDDYISPDMYSKMFSLANNQSADIVICGFKKIFTNKKYIKYYSQLLTEGKIYKNKEIKDVILKSYYDGIDIVIPTLWNKLYKTNLLKSNNLFIDERYVRAEDYWFNFNVFKVARSVIYINEPFYNYCENENSIMHSFKSNQFEQSTKTHEILLIYNKDFKFKIDKNKFYKSYLYETAMIIREFYSENLNKKERVKRLNSIVQNNIYQDAINYTSLVPIHIKLLSKIAKLNSIVLLDLLYRLWNRVS